MWDKNFKDNVDRKVLQWRVHVDLLSDEGMILEWP